MNRKTLSLTLALTMLFSTVVNIQFQRSPDYARAAESLTSQESQVVSLVNGTNAYGYDLELEKITLNQSVSGYSFRSGGSVGATATAMWLRDKMVGYGLDVSLESFEFTNWNLPSQPILIIDEDGDNSTTNDQTQIESFQSEHFSWPTPEGGVFADLVVLPLPIASNFSDMGRNPVNTTLWDSINTRGRIVLIGREIRWNGSWEESFKTKLSTQPPAVVVYTWWYPWMSFCPPLFSSTGGRPTSSLGSYYWNLHVPAGWVNYEDGVLIREKDSLNMSAKVAVPSVIDSGPHYNVVGKLRGDANESRVVIVSGHYDTVMTSGFVDNGAGMSAVLELARVFTKAAKEGLFKPRYSILFIGFASEELNLVGSSNYVRQHKSEMKDIVAVVNVDCVGSDSLYVTRTEPGEGFDLDVLVQDAASDLNTSAKSYETEGSDQEAFRDPNMANSIYSQSWSGLSVDIADAVPVKSSALLVSFPLRYSDKWDRGSPGWIHTSYDNSTSTETLSWLELDNSEEQIRVAALSVMRVSQLSLIVDGQPPFFLFLVLGVIVAAVVVVVVYFVKLRKPPR